MTLIKDFVKRYFKCNFFFFLIKEPAEVCSEIRFLLQSCSIDKYVVGLKKFVERQMVDKLLSKNFRRHSTSSTKHFVEKYFVEKFSSTKHFVDTAFRRHGTSSTRHFVDTALRRHGTSSTQHFVDRSLHR